MSDKRHEFLAHDEGCACDGRGLAAMSSGLRASGEDTHSLATCKETWRLTNSTFDDEAFRQLALMRHQLRRELCLD